MKQLLVLSGKGGTGKTTLVSSFIELGGFKAYADCDVDAPNLYLISGEEMVEPITDDYYGMDKVQIDQNKCVRCGKCKNLCRFDGVYAKEGRYYINKYNCEGCGVCKEFCPKDAISFVPNIAGKTEIYNGNHYLSTAELKMGEGNSGLLVTKVKENLKKKDEPITIVDGSPGIGCPVIASISGVTLVLIVTEPSLSGLSDLERIVATARHFNVTPKVVINKYNINLEKSDTIEEYCKDEDIEVIGKIPFENKCNDLINNRQTLVSSNTEAAEEIKKIYDKTIKILNEED